MAVKKFDPPPHSGDVIRQMDEHLTCNTISITRRELLGWRDRVIEMAAELDPDNRPLTEADFKRMKRRLPRVR